MSYINRTQLAALELLKSALWGTELNTEIADWNAVYGVLVQHAVAGLAGNCLMKWNIHDELRKKWKHLVYQQVFRYHAITDAQKELLSLFAKSEIPIVVVKGTAAACYYPVPEYRTLGDIDFLVHPDYYSRACAAAAGNGWIEVPEDNDRHTTYSKNGIVIEIHCRFASENALKYTGVFDDFLFEDISSGRQQLSHAQNGLVLLEHIVQHMRAGIGLRQIIDWMMFVDKCLDDDLWHKQFREMAEKTELDRFAIAVTRMCQIYLGLNPMISWCADADPELCTAMMDYIMDCGNFGSGLSLEKSGAAARLPSPKHPIRLFRYVQEHGQQNWSLLKKHPCLKPFAFIYQALRYIKMILSNRISIKGVYDEGQKRNEMFEKLKIYQVSSTTPTK